MTLTGFEVTARILGSTIFESSYLLSKVFSLDTDEHKGKNFDMSHVDI